jgi:hypothetical protein
VEYPVPVDPNRAIVKYLNTGFNSSAGTQLANGSPDNNYMVLGNSGQLTPHAQSSPLPGTWLSDAASSQSRWIVLSGNGQEGISVSAGTYTFETTVDLTGYNPATAEIVGLQFAADDNLLSISVDGNQIYTPGSNGFTQFYAVQNIGLGAFHAGVNTIDFQVQNGSLSPMGLRAEGWVAAVVPEPSSLALLAAGAIVFAEYRRRRSLVSKY